MMKAKIVIVGADPGAHASPATHIPLYPWPRGASGHKLRDIMGLSDGEYTTYTDRVNLMDGPTDWKTGRAELRAAGLLRGGLLRDRVVVLLGSYVADAFRGASATLKAHLDEPFSYVVLNSTASSLALPKIVGLAPHPSGRNHFYNDPENVEAARKFFAEMYRVAAGGRPRVKMEEEE